MSEINNISLAKTLSESG